MELILAVLYTVLPDWRFIEIFIQFCLWVHSKI
jgi:hypothetical protein